MTGDTTMPIEINYTRELYTVAAKALRDRDVETLEKLTRIVEGWVQPEEETEAQLDLLNAMLEAAHDLNDYEER